MKYKIFVDTNQTIRKAPPLNKVFSDRVKQLYDFLEENNIKDKVTICLPEVVIKERIQHRLEDVEKRIETANNSIRDLCGMGYEVEEVTPRDDHEAVLEESADQFIDRFNIERVNYPSIGNNEFIDRAICKIEPFDDHGSGFKDTLIFLSIMEVAKKSSEDTHYIFCTSDSDFGDQALDEFKNETGNRLCLVKNIVEAQEKLDELVPLERHLETRNDKVEQVIRLNAGTLVEESNKLLPKEGESPFYSVYDHESKRGRLHSSLYEYKDWREERICAFNFDDIELTKVHELDDESLGISGVLEVSPIYYERDKGSSESILTKHRPSLLYNTSRQPSTHFRFEFDAVCSLQDPITDSIFNIESIRFQS